MKAQTLYRGENKKKDRPTKAEKTYDAVKKWKAKKQVINSTKI